MPDYYSQVRMDHSIHPDLVRLDQRMHHEVLMRLYLVGLLCTHYYYVSAQYSNSNHFAAILLGLSTPGTYHSLLEREERDTQRQMVYQAMRAELQEDCSDVMQKLLGKLDLDNWVIEDCR